MDQNGKDDLKTQFITREGTYRLITLSEYSRPNRVGYQSNQNNPQVRVSLLPAKVNSDVSTPNNTGSTVLTGSTNVANITNASATNNSNCILQQPSANTNISGITNGISEISSQHQQFQQGFSDKICFNFGKELYVYTYRGVKKNVDLCKPIDKKLYKGTSPSCHDFNGTTAVNDCSSLLVGFTTGQIQLVQPGKRETGRLYNEERLIDKTKVTCLKWLPKSPNLFLASHSSGYLYLYNEELPCCPNVPNYQNYKTGDGFTILTCKSKASRNPLYKWVFNSDNCSINEFSFSPCGTMLAIVSQDGFLRVFYYDTMELLGIARSYFGGFLCVCWSPDSKYVVVGGEDDLVTVWSVIERRVVARGQGHRSWVSVVAFDPYTSYSHSDSSDLSDDDNTANYSSNGKVQKNTDDITEDIPFISRNNTRRTCCDDLSGEKISTSYRLGSVGQDTQLCLWDITEDILRQSYDKRHRRGSLETQNDNHHNDIQIVKVPSEGDNNSNSKINSFRSKFTLVTSTEGSESSNNTEVLDNSIVSTKPTNSFSKLCSNSTNATNMVEKSINVSGTIPVKTDSTYIASNETPLNKGNNFKISESAINPFNSLTQRLSHFNFVNDKKSSSVNQYSHRKPFIFAKSSSNHAPFSANNCTGNKNGNESEISSSIKNSKHLNNIPSTYDPMKLIGSAACPRFDECPLLEPLVCKKIAHERLTALIFREDCFLTACQDGFIYTWARPGYSSNPQHNIGHSNSPTGAYSGTVV